MQKNTSDKHGRCERQLAAEKKDVSEGVIGMQKGKWGKKKVSFHETLGL